MATTVFLNSPQTVWVTTYFGGLDKGTYFDVSMQLDEETQVTRTFTVRELRAVLIEKGQIRGLAKPEAENARVEDVLEIE